MTAEEILPQARTILAQMSEQHQRHCEDIQGWLTQITERESALDQHYVSLRTATDAILAAHADYGRMLKLLDDLLERVEKLERGYE